MPFPSHLAVWSLIALLAGASVCAAEAPRVVETLFPTEDVVIATQVVDAPRDGAADAAPAIQAAVDSAAGAGGGVVFLPAGRYRLAGRLTLKEGVTLRGDWAPPAEKGWTRGTLLLITADRGSADAPAAITLERGSGIREVALWYPEQDAAAPVPYPWALRTSATAAGDNTTIQNVTLVNPYQAIRVGPEWNELHTVRNVFGTPLKCGLWIDTCTDIGRLTDVTFAPSVWEDSGLPGAPARGDAGFRAWLRREGTGVEMGRSDWEYLYNVTVEGYATGLVIRQGAQGTTNAVLYGGALRDCETALRLESLNGVGLAATGCRFEGRRHAVHAPASFRTVTQFNTCEFTGPVLMEGAGTLTFQNCAFAGGPVDAREGRLSLMGCRFAPAGGLVALGEGMACARLLGNEMPAAWKVTNAGKGDVQIAGGIPFAQADVAPHRPAPHPRPAGKGLFVVSDYGAAPAAADNTAAFARALDAAGKARGGTVFVPAGNYRFAGQLVVPTGVEVRGCFDVPHHTVSAGSVLMPTAGRGSEEGTPFLRLSPRSGLRGLTVWYPEQDPRAPAAYPWAVQSTGPGCWLLDVTLGNAYQGADFWTHPSDGHVIRYLAGGFFRRGLFVSKCKGDGWVEDVQFNPHYALRLHKSLPRPKSEGDAGGVLIDYQREHLDGIVFGRCEREHVRGTFLYAAHDGIAFRDDGGGANARVIQHGTDTASRAAVMERTGPAGVQFLNAQLVPLGKWEKGAIIVPDSFTGKTAFFNTQIWAGNTTALIGGRGEVLLQQMNTLSGGVRLAGSRCTLENVVFGRDLEPHATVAAGAMEARLTGNLSPDAFRMRKEAGAHCAGLANALSRGGLALPHPTNFRTGWEPDDPQGPADTVATRGGGMRSVSGGTCRPTDAGAHAGRFALRLAGTADDPAYSHIYYRVLETQLSVNRDSVLTYWIRPLNERGRHTGIDLLFADGSVLRDSGARTDDGQGVHTGGPRGKVGEWTRIRIPLGRYLAGKEIAAFLFAYDSRGGGGPFEALVDDLSLESRDALFPGPATAVPAGGRCRAGTRVALSVPGGAGLRYTLDGSDPDAESPRYEAPIVLKGLGLCEVRWRVQRKDGQLGGCVYGALYEVVP